MSSFGKRFKITTYGESHCKSVGVIVEGCPSGMSLNESDIQLQLSRRRPGQSQLSTPRKEEDQVEIQSGIENGVTLGTPICAIVKNKDTRPQDYKFSKTNYIPRPSHADLSYILKYKFHASSGGGRSSARETIGRVIGGSIAEKWLKSHYGIQIIAWVSQVGYFKYNIDDDLLINRDTIARYHVDMYPTRCPNYDISNQMEQLILDLKDKGDSIGGVVSCICRKVPGGIGEPCFDKLEAMLAHAMLSIPATKGFEIGSGFSCVEMKGSEHNDLYTYKNSRLGTQTNNSGGIQGGISNGEDIYFNVAFKPPATISLPQNTTDMMGNSTILEAKGRHDPCVVNRAVPIVETMAALTIMDALLLQFGNK